LGIEFQFELQNKPKFQLSSHLPEPKQFIFQKQKSVPNGIEGKLLV